VSATSRENGHIAFQVAAKGASDLERKARVAKRAGRGNPAENLLYGGQGPCYTVFAFVALVRPLDSLKGAASSHNLRPLLLYGWGHLRSIK